MTQIERTLEKFATLEKGTIITKEQYREMRFEKSRKGKRFDPESRCYLASWEVVTQNPDRFNVERVEIFHTVPTSKVTTVDVLEMVKKGCSVEEIEKAIYTTTKEIRLKIK